MREMVEKDKKVISAFLSGLMVKYPSQQIYYN